VGKLTPDERRLVQLYVKDLDMCRYEYHDIMYSEEALELMHDTLSFALWSFRLECSILWSEVKKVLK